MEAKDKTNENQDKITICVYFKESDEDLKDNIANEIEKIKDISKKFYKVDKDERPLNISVSVLVVPDWKNNSSYAGEEYLKKKESVIKKMNDEFKVEVEVSDFFNGLEETYEKSYLKGLYEGSNCLDMMKIKSIISNKECRHLQLDSNTIITNYSNLYEKTFSADQQYDALNACFYGYKKVMPHSKIVYTFPDGKLRECLYNSYWDKIKNESFIEERNERSKFYNSIFVSAAIKSGVAIAEGNYIGTAKILDKDKNPIPEYRITRDILSVTTQSWKKKGDKSLATKFTLPTITINGIQCSHDVIKSLIKKHYKKTCPVEAHDQLITISNVVLESGIIKAYLKECDENQIAELIKSIPNKELREKFKNQLQENSSIENNQRFKDEYKLFSSKSGTENQSTQPTTLPILTDIIP